MINYHAWLSGAYFRHAIGSIIDGRKNKYPQNPLKEEEIIDNDMILTEEEKQIWTEKLFGKLQNMMDKRTKSN